MCLLRPIQNEDVPEQYLPLMRVQQISSSTLFKTRLFGSKQVSLNWRVLKVTRARSAAVTIPLSQRSGAHLHYFNFGALAREILISGCVDPVILCRTFSGVAQTVSLPERSEGSSCTALLGSGLPQWRLPGHFDGGRQKNQRHHYTVPKKGIRSVWVWDGIKGAERPAACVLGGGLGTGSRNGKLRGWE
ncbi:hypothetical protein B0H13DRAFT_1852008 [Mycena leptocephala]|nr:hypothetical protein B0H13DRAFT_1852008 [Mycena leptocephala]